MVIAFAWPVVIFFIFYWDLGKCLVRGWCLVDSVLSLPWVDLRGRKREDEGGEKMCCMLI